jgi:sialate O-acetylesterase
VSGWPELREAQLQTLRLNNTGMAVTIDIGDSGDIHPKNKQDVGLRLALPARALAYGQKLVYSGPIFRQQTIEGGVAAPLLRPRRRRAGRPRWGAEGL